MLPNKSMDLTGLDAAVRASAKWRDGAGFAGLLAPGGTIERQLRARPAAHRHDIRLHEER